MNTEPEFALESIQSGGRLPDSDAGVRAIVDLARETAEVGISDIKVTGLGAGLPECVPVLIDRRPGKGIIPLKDLIETYRQAPARKRGLAIVDTLDSLIGLTNRHKTADSAIFAKAQWPEPSLTAVIDYHKIDGVADWGQHRLVYRFPITDEFKAWTNNNGKAMDQGEFAQFMEDHAAELTAPYDQERNDYERLFKCTFATPNVLIDLARSLEIHVNHQVKQGIRLQTGESVVEFKEEHANGKGEPVTIPGVFMVAVPAFIGGQPVRIPARLRYRLSSGNIKWSYHLYRPAEWLREMVQADMAAAAEKTGLPAYEGTPEASQ